MVRFKEVCQLVLRYRDSRDRLVRRTVMALLPRLAHFSAEQFINEDLEQCISYLVSSLRSGTERTTAFLAIGEIALAVGPNIDPYLDSIVALVKDGLSNKNRRNFCQEALTCLAMLTQAVGTSMESHVLNLIDDMFAGGLSQALVDALRDIVQHIPSLTNQIQRRIIHECSKVLADAPYEPPAIISFVPGRTPIISHRLSNTSTNSTSGTVSSAASTAVATLQRLRKAPATTTSAPQPEDPDLSLVTLALYTFGNFNLEGHLLLPFVGSCIVQYLDFDNPIIRKEAALTCAKLVLRPGELPPRRGPTATIVSEILTRLLAVGISDPIPSVRATVIGALEERFDVYLAQVDLIIKSVALLIKNIKM